MEKPPHPPSAYNLFFQVERKRILDGVDHLCLPITAEEVQAVLSAKKNQPKRKHRKSHGMFSFKDLTKMIAAKWKHIDPESLRVLTWEAEHQRKIYKVEVKKWKASQRTGKKDAGNPDQFSPGTEESGSSAFSESEETLPNSRESEAHGHSDHPWPYPNGSNAAVPTSNVSHGAAAPNQGPSLGISAALPPALSSSAMGHCQAYHSSDRVGGSAQMDRLLTQMSQSPFSHNSLAAHPHGGQPHWTSSSQAAAIAGGSFFQSNTNFAAEGDDDDAEMRDCQIGESTSPDRGGGIADISMREIYDSFIFTSACSSGMNLMEPINFEAAGSIF